MTLHIHNIRVIRLFVPFVIPYSDFITNYAFGRMTRILTGYFLVRPKLHTPRLAAYLQEAPAHTAAPR